MNDTCTIIPPNQATENTSAPATVVLKICINKHPLSELHWPSHNRIGMVLLVELLTARLKAEGITVMKLPGSLGELNHSYYSFPVSNPVTAAQVVKKEILRLFLGAFAHIGWYDPLEKMYRVVHSPEGLQFPEITPEEFEEERRALAGITAKYDQAIKYLQGLLRKPQP